MNDEAYLAKLVSLAEGKAAPKKKVAPKKPAPSTPTGPTGGSN